MRLLLLSSLLFTVALAVIRLDGGGRGGGRRPHGGRYFGRSSSSSSSESHEHGPRPRPPRPPPRPRPPPVSVPQYTCQSGWLQFKRAQGDWCVLVSNSGGISQPAAETICRGYGATLTGIQNSNERMAIANEGLKMMNAQGQLVGGLWLGATNLPGCKIPSCGPLNTFVWTDDDTVGTDGFHFGRDEPDNVDWPGSTICIQQFIINSAYYSSPGAEPAWTNYFVHGDLDKYQCGYPALPQFRLYACGKKATLTN